MSQPLVSVIIPTYNRKELCKRAVSSVFSQTNKDYELIVIDDCSNDGTSAKYLCEGSKSLIYKKLGSNSGVSRARNIGVDIASGTWLAFLDSDDVWHPKKLEKQIAWTHENRGYSIVQTKEVWIRNGVRVNPPKTHEKIGGSIFRESLVRCMITPSSVMIRKDFFNEIGRFNESLPACEDYDLWLRISVRHPVGLVEEMLMTRYGGHEDQLSSSVEVLDRYRIRALMDLLRIETDGFEHREYVYKLLVKKADIVANGAKKRNRMKEYECFRNIADKYRAFC